MGHRLHQPGPWLTNMMYYKLFVGSKDGSSAASARTLLLKALAQEHHFNQRWLKNLKAQETEWFKNRDGSSAMVAQEQ